MGNLSRDPEIRYTTGENPLAIARFSIAVNRRFTRQGDPDVDFFNCTAFGKTGENISKFFTKGKKILISGRLQNNSWEDNNGQKRVSTDIIVEEFDFCEKNTGDNSSSQRTNNSNRPTENQSGYEAADDDEDLPF